MKLEKFVKIFAATLALLLFTVLSVQAQTLIYDNGVNGNDMGKYLSMTNGQITGQEILPALGSTPYLNEFNFEFYSANTFLANSVSVDVQFFNNNGTPPFNGYATPGSLFYDSGWIGLVAPQDTANGGSGDPGHVQVWDFQWQDLYGGAAGFNDSFPYTPALAMNTQIALPSDFTVVFTFTGLDPANNFGLELFYPNGNGTNYGDYWVNSGTELSPTWALYTNSAAYPSGIGMQFSGTADPTPEPSVIAMGVMGGLLMTHLIRRRKV